MRIIIVGYGTIARALRVTLIEAGHTVVLVGPDSGDYQADISDVDGLRSLLASIGSFDAVACAAPDAFGEPQELEGDSAWARLLNSFEMRQISMSRTALALDADHAPISILSDLLSSDVIDAGVLGVHSVLLPERSSAAPSPQFG